MVATEKPPSYVELLMHVQPRPIHTEDEAREVQEAINGMLRREQELSDDEIDLLKLLTLVKTAWENDNHRLADAGPNDIIRFLLTEHGMTQSDLVRQGIFRTRAQASQVITGTRRLTYDHAANLAALFHVSPAVFFPRRSR